MACLKKETKAEWNYSALRLRFRTLGSISEGKFETELDLARRQRGIEPAERIVSCIEIIPNKVGVIEDVEEFGTELDSVTFFESPILVH